MTKNPRNTLHGWINLTKPLHLTSADAVFQVKRLIHPSKIGHAGTLDPLATGVLPLALGEGTKCINLLMDAKKTYEFSVTFGQRRSTDDAEGEVVATSERIPTETEIRAILPQFTGEIMQTPPIYSALKVAGKRAYAMARAGQEVVLEPRPVTIYALELVNVQSHHTPERNSDSVLATNVATGETLSPCGRGLGEGASELRSHMPLAHQQKAIDRAQALRQNATDVEMKLWNALRDRRLEGFKFRRQHPIEQYIVDFICLEHRLIIELDGGQHSENMVQDAKRTAYLESQGFRVIRYWNHEVIENFEGVLTDILAHPLTQPSPARGEGSLVSTFAVQNQQKNALLEHTTCHAPPTVQVAHFRAVVSKGTYIRSLGRDIAQKLGSEGYISRLHRAAVGPFTDANAISLDFLAESVHKAPPLGDVTSWLTPLERALDDIPALTLDSGQLQQLRHGQRVTLVAPYPDTPQLVVMEGDKMAGMARVERNQVISTRLLVTK